MQKSFLYFYITFGTIWATAHTITDRFGPNLVLCRPPSTSASQKLPREPLLKFFLGGMFFVPQGIGFDFCYDLELFLLRSSCESVFHQNGFFPNFVKSTREILIKHVRKLHRQVVHDLIIVDLQLTYFCILSNLKFSRAINFRELRDHYKNAKIKKSELDLTQDIQFLGIRLRLDLGEASLPESKAWEIVARARHLSSLHVLSYVQVSQLMGSLNWASGLITLGRLYLRPLQRHFHSLGLRHRVDQTLWSLPTFYGRTHVFLPQESLSTRFRRSSRFSRTPPRRGGAPTWGIPRFSGTASSTSIAWSSRRYFMPYSIGLQCSRATRL